MINTPDIYIKSILNGDERAYSLLFRIFAQDHDELKLKAACFLAKQVRELDYFSIIRIDQQMRQAIEVNWLIDWRSIPIERFFCKQMTEDERRAVLVFASFHPSGFVREAATRAISHYQGTLPYIILRLNDWVSTVRHAAKISFSHRIASPVFGELSQAFPFVIKLEKGMRDNHHAAVDTLCSLLMAPEHEQELNIILESRYCIVRRVCVKTLCRDVQHNIKIIKNHFLKETDPFIKLFILEKLLLAEHTWQPELLEILAKDKYYKIRLFYLKIKRQNENKESQFEPYLLDSNAHVRRLTRQIIGSLNACYDFQHFYLQHLDGTQQAAAMIGFAEVSQQKDCAVLEPYLETKDARVLCALIKALMSLNFEYYEHKMVEYLNDSRHCVVNKTSFCKSKNKKNIFFNN